MFEDKKDQKDVQVSCAKVSEHQFSIILVSCVLFHIYRKSEDNVFFLEYTAINDYNGDICPMNLSIIDSEID